MSSHSDEHPSSAHEDNGDWRPGPSRPQLTRGAAHVWRADLRSVADGVTEALDAAERRRAERITGERERRSWARSRGVLRDLLARYLRCGAEAVELVAGAQGKPELAHLRDDGERLFFNLSHSADLALYAFSVDGPVGVDVQAPRGERGSDAVDHVALARRAFGEHEAQRLSLVAPASREREFLRAWAHHEAQLKWRGTGIGGSQGRVERDSRPWLAELDLGANVAAALALDEPAHELARWSWA